MVKNSEQFIFPPCVCSFFECACERNSKSSKYFQQNPQQRGCLKQLILDVQCDRLQSKHGATKHLNVIRQMHTAPNKGLEKEKNAFIFFLLCYFHFFSPLEAGLQACSGTNNSHNPHTGKEIKQQYLPKFLELNNVAVGHGAKPHSQHPPTPPSLHSHLFLSGTALAAHSGRFLAASKQQNTPVLRYHQASVSNSALRRTEGSNQHTAKYTTCCFYSLQLIGSCVVATNGVTNLKCSPIFYSRCNNWGNLSLSLQ